jgi:inhibitor-of-growth protein 2
MDEVPTTNSVVVTNSTINNSFISTVDHLPCDVIRSLWLVQSINIAIEKNNNELHEILLRIQKSPLETSNYIQRIVHCKSMITRLGNEATQEISALNNQLITHTIGLNDELRQLREIADVKLHNQDDLSDKKHLREQLIHHYKQHPLQSQVEALKHQKITKITIKQNQKPSGLKLVLKLSKTSQTSNRIKKPIVKPKTKIVQQQMAIEPEPPKEEEDTNSYCFCKQGSFGDMIACDNEESCGNGEWFHYKCVGLLNRVDALKYTTGKEKWYCSEKCREIAEERNKKIVEKRKKARRRRW